MKEEHFILFYKVNKGLDSIEEAREKVELFWETLIEVLQSEDEIKFRNWGKFKIKRCKIRKYSSPYSKEIGYTKSKYIITFKIGETLKKFLNTYMEELLWLKKSLF